MSFSGLIENNYANFSLCTDTMEWTEKSVQLLLDLLLEFRDGFSSKDGDQADATVWEVSCSTQQ